MNDPNTKQEEQNLDSESPTPALDADAEDRDLEGDDVHLDNTDV